MMYELNMVQLMIFLLSQISLALIFVSKFAWHYKKRVVSFSVFSLIISSVMLLFYSDFILYNFIFIYVSFFSLFNCLKIYKSRINYTFLYRSSSRTYIFTSLILTFVLFLIQLDFYNVLNPSLLFFLTIFSITSLFTGILLLSNSYKNIINSKPVGNKFDINEKNIPTLSVAIPVRNEDPSLEHCLDSVDNDTYPKREIVVYDDESHDNTAEIIKSYAQRGVRFIRGKKVPSGWLAKNFAYQNLLDNSSGEYILFMGANVRLHKNSIEGIIKYMKFNEIDMLSVIPKIYPKGFLNVLIQPMRYWWEISWFRLFKSKTPPSLGVCWAVNRKALVDKGGFTAYKNSIMPEIHLSRMFNDEKKYSFLQITKDNLITNHYTFIDQLESAVRNRYPQFHRRPENVLLITLIYIFILLMPFIIIPFALIDPSFALYTLYVFLVAMFLLIINHFAVSKVINLNFSFISFFNFPLVILSDMITMIISMIKYEFGQVTWRGRNISSQTMNVYKSLPKID